MILEKATELGVALSNSDEFKRMQRAKNALEANEHVKELMKQYREKQNAVVTMSEAAEANDMRISGLVKEIDDLQTELVSNPVFSEMMEAQGQFALLMNEVNKVVSAYIGIEEKSGTGCKGDCSGCSGCVH